MPDRADWFVHDDGTGRMIASIGSNLAVSAAAIAVLMFSTWLLSLALRDASIVDIIWGAGFVVVAWSTFVAADGGPRELLVALMVTAWGLRLSAYLWWRNHGKGEDYRYVAMRKHFGAKFPIVSLFTVFGLQGVLMWIVSLPVQVSSASRTDIDLFLVLGAALWIVGLGFESVGDAQLAQFKANPANAGTVMDRGLWRFTRHPNYFGDFCVWWGIYVTALGTPWGWATIMGPIAMSTLLIRVSGKGLLEKTIGRRRAGYDKYIATTSGFFPRPPKRVA